MLSTDSENAPAQPAGPGLRIGARPNHLAAAVGGETGVTRGARGSSDAMALFASWVGTPENPWVGTPEEDIHTR